MKKTLWIISALVAIITAVAIQFMPDKIPAHYNMSGEIDRFGSKYELLIYPVIIFIMNIFWVVIIKNFEKKHLMPQMKKFLHSVLQILKLSA